MKANPWLTERRIRRDRIVRDTNVTERKIIELNHLRLDAHSTIITKLVHGLEFLGAWKDDPDCAGAGAKDAVH